MYRLPGQWKQGGMERAWGMVLTPMIAVGRRVRTASNRLVQRDTSCANGSLCGCSSGRRSATTRPLLSMK